jgi:lipid-A-disaccharide synthase
LPRRIMMIAGEASGDLHGSGVVRELMRRDPQADVFGIGGARMRNEGMDVVVDISSLSFMGFAEVLKNLANVRRVGKAMERLLVSRRPDVVVLIDYPGFNLRFARKAKARSIPVLYYISPQVWAWHRGRVKKMKRSVDRMKVVFPFEVDMYRDEGIDVEFVGHPIVERIGSRATRREFFEAHGFRPDKRLLGLLPGSRLQEIEHILPVMARAAEELVRRFDIQAAVGVAPNLGVRAVRSHLPPETSLICVEHGTHDLMCHADAVIVTSGTATLETGWFGTPMVIVYRTSPITFAIGKMLVDVPHIGLVNIVAGRKIVPELLQNEMTEENICAAIGRILSEASYAAQMRKDLSVIRAKLGGPGASARVADGIFALEKAA